MNKLSKKNEPIIIKTIKYRRTDPWLLLYIGPKKYLLNLSVLNKITYIHIYKLNIILPDSLPSMKVNI
jgi:hypothetical protein